jgi:VIT1/CCC1 family predicted Fe2+/Mn2+ transporter
MNDTHQSLRTGLSFGMTSGVITTLGLIVGLHSGTHSRSVVIGAILVIAVSDAFSDSLGIHLSEEAENVHTDKQIWTSTVATFLSKFAVTLSFLAPVLLVQFPSAIAVSAAWGLVVIIVLSWSIARVTRKRPLAVIVEHVVIAAVVVGLSHLVGTWVGQRFG